jgi:hypothetical protein
MRIRGLATGALALTVAACGGGGGVPAATAGKRALQSENAHDHWSGGSLQPFG